MLEKDIERWLRKEVERRGGLCLKWVSPGCRGVPDRIIITPEGRTVYVELKTDAGRLSPGQAHVIGRLRCRGADVRVLHGVEQVKAFVEEVIPCYSSRTRTKSSVSKK
jgi:hypothetical protein